MKRRILVIGNFGYLGKNLNGQTVRTRTIYQTLTRYLPNNTFKIEQIDTSNKNNIRTKIELLIKYTRSKTILILPAQKAIKYIVPIIYISNILFKKEIQYVAIGGWLADFLNNNKKFKKYFKKFDNIFVQTKSLKRRLNELGLTNVIHLPNYRIYTKKIHKPRKVEKVKKIVFFSRVTPKKGIEMAINTVNKIDDIELYIYGPIDIKYEERFKSIIMNNSRVHYNGIIEPDNILETLTNYDLLLFPTYYDGEGFPGTILDSMTAGVPIIASDWKYNSEVVIHGYNGLLFKVKDTYELTQQIQNLQSNIEKINEMKENCIKESRKYDAEEVSKILINKIIRQ